MKISLKNSKRAAVLVTALALVFCASCGKPQTEQRRDYKAEAEAASVHCVSKADCYLCGDGNIRYKEYYSQNNVGIISLNTFELLPIEINRYDQSGQLIEENTGCMVSSRFTGDEDGFSANLMLDADRGVADAQLSFNADQRLRLERTAQHLCEEHFREFVSDLYGNPYGVGIVDLENAKLYPIKENVIAFQAGDYYIHCDSRETDRDGNPLKMSVYVVYTPLRYGEEKAE